MALIIVIVAAGEGTRMRSERPKVLHQLAGKTLLQHVHETAIALAPARVMVVYGHGGELAKEQLSHLNTEWVEQPRQLGLGTRCSRHCPIPG